MPFEGKNLTSNMLVQILKIPIKMNENEKDEKTDYKVPVLVVIKTMNIMIRVRQNKFMSLKDFYSEI